MRKFMVAICVTFLMAFQCACLQVAFADDQYTAGSSPVLTAAETSDEPINAGDRFIKWKASMPSTGNVRALALYVTFSDSDTNSDAQFAGEDTADAFQSILGPTVGSDENAASTGGIGPFGNVAAYYKKSSYNGLNIQADVVAVKLPNARSNYQMEAERQKSVAPVVEAALNALKNDTTQSIDFSKYDGNGDKIIDCVYVHFAGAQNAEDQSSVWWSSTGSFETDVELGGNLKAQTFVSLHQRSDTQPSVATAIHETGHAMGLPDYYSTSGEGDQQIDGKKMLGIGTFDMMFNSSGDHNGFSKWLLGWIGKSNITYVVANASGITVTRNGKTEQKIEPTDGGSSVIVSLESFTKAGDIVVVSTDDLESPYSSYFILEYDRAAGNNAMVQVVDKSQDSGFGPLPNGLRVFRVQAGPETGAPTHSDNNGVSGNRLIELIDPDGSSDHERAENGSYNAAGVKKYGCMLFEGQSLGSKAPSSGSLQAASVEETTPGTTLDGKGTGIGIKVLSIDGDNCQVLISYGESKPDPDPDPEPTPAPITVKHKVMFKANGHGKAPAMQVVNDGDKAKKPADPTADGWTFGGWYTDKDCKQAYDFSKPVTADQTLYAKWTQKNAAAATKANQANKTQANAKSTTSKTGDSPLVVSLVAIAIVSGTVVVMSARRSRER